MTRREVLRGLGVIGLGSGLDIRNWSLPTNLITRTIPASGERIPVIGMGSWITFDVLGTKAEANMKQVLQVFHQLGGRVIDSSPMYGSSEQTIGKLARELGILQDLWVSTKVWTDGSANGLRQMQQSNQYFNSRVCVNHIHNIRDFQTHYDNLIQAKAAGTIRYVGVTHYQNHAHDQLATLIDRYDLDFVQFNFNIENPHAEERLIPAAVDRGVATIVNRPFQTGRLFQMIQHKSLPPWAMDWGISSWAEFMLKYIISHPGITCVIPATSQVDHARENMKAGLGYLPVAKEREKMRAYFSG